MSKEKDKKKGKRGNNSKELNVIPFKIKSLKDQKIETENEIWAKIDSFSEELVKAFKKRAIREAISSDYCWYIFYYRVMQSLMSEMSYPAFKYYTNWTRKQLLTQQKEFMNSFDEWTSNPDEEEDL